MKVLLCGASRIADELLKRLGNTWEVTLVDKLEKKMNTFSSRFVSVVRLVAGDASSPVVLDKAGLEEQDFVLALTDEDDVNLAISTFAAEKKIKNVMALVHDPEQLPKFNEIDVRALPMTSFLARKIYRYLQDPRMKVSMVGQGEGELMEVEIGPNLMVMGKKVQDFSDRNWRIVGIIRGNKLVFTDEGVIFREGDRLIILGKPDLVKAVCSVMECRQPLFPMVYGNELVVALPARAREKASDIVHESIYLAQNTKTQHIYILCEKGVCDFREDIQRWSESLDIQIQEKDEKIEQQIHRICEQRNVGVVVLPSLDSALLDSLTKPTLITLAHKLPCPLLVAKSSNPYGKILVPYNGSPKTGMALEVAIDLVQQHDAELTVVVVKEPEFLHGEDAGEEPWIDKQLKKVRELGRAHKIKIGEEVLSGNPVNQITELTRDFNLMVMGSTSREKEFLSPHVGELLVRKAECSVLIITD